MKTNKTITDQICELADKGLTQVEIRDRVGRRYQQVRNTLLRKGYEIAPQGKEIVYTQKWEYIDPISGVPVYA